MSGSHHHHHGRPPRDANAEASAVRGRLAWVRSTFSPMMVATIATASEGGERGEGAGSGGRSGSGGDSSPAVADVAPGGSRSIASQVVAAYSDILEGERERRREKEKETDRIGEIGSSFVRFSQPPKLEKQKTELIADVAVEAHRAWRTGAASRTPAGVNLEGPPPLLERRRSDAGVAAAAAPAAPPRAAAVAEAAAAVAPPPAPAPPPPPARLSRVDAFGQPLKASSAGDVACPTCGRRVAAARFAPHLEKCLGGGRAAGRARAAAAR